MAVRIGPNLDQNWLRTVRQLRSSVVKMMVHILMLVKTVKSMLWMSLMGVQGTTGMISTATCHSPLIHESGRRGEAKLCNHNKPKSCGRFWAKIIAWKVPELTVQGALFKHFGWKIGWGYFWNPASLELCEELLKKWKKKLLNLKLAFLTQINSMYTLPKNEEIGSSCIVA